MKEIILASASPRRKELLEQVGISYKILPSNFEENIEELKGIPEKKAEQLAVSKAQEVARGLQSGLVLGADTIVVIDDEILGKPKNDEDAFNMLQKLSGREHRVITAISLIDIERGIEIVDHEITKVKFRTLPEESIRAYILSKEPQGKAGAYAIQGKGAIFVEGIEGCYSNVVGLPLTKLTKKLEELGVNVWQP